MRLTNIHTGKGNFGFSEALHKERVPKYSKIFDLYNEVQSLTNLIKLNLYFVKSEKDKKFLNELICDKWLGGILGSLYFKFRKLGVSTEVRSWMEKRIKFLCGEVPDAYEFVLEDKHEALKFNQVVIKARKCEIDFWGAFTAMYGENVIENLEKSFDNDLVKTTKANAEFFNLLGDYLFILLRYELKDSPIHYWNNPNQSQEKIEECLLREIGLPEC